MIQPNTLAILLFLGDIEGDSLTVTRKVLFFIATIFNGVIKGFQSLTVFDTVVSDMLSKRLSLIGFCDC